MANRITRHIPNAVTCLNLFSGCIACVMAFQSQYEAAFLFIVLSAVFDFFDGMLARLLKAYSDIGKDLDSLADDVSFGAAPAFMVFSLLREMPYPGYMEGMATWFPYLGFLIAVFSALRLAKFNNDTRQTTSFIGLPVPANALFWASLTTGHHSLLTGGNVHPLVVVALVCLFSWLLVCEMPMFSLKFKNLSWRDNKVTFIFLGLCAILLLTQQVKGMTSCIVTYILFSWWFPPKKA